MVSQVMHMCIQTDITAQSGNAHMYSTAQMQGITNARYERVYTRQRTRLREAANAITRERKRVHTRRLTRLHEAANAFPRGGERGRTRTRTRSHEEANALK